MYAKIIPMSQYQVLNVVTKIAVFCNIYIKLPILLLVKQNIHSSKKRGTHSKIIRSQHFHAPGGILDPLHQGSVKNFILITNGIQGAVA